MGNKKKILLRLFSSNFSFLSPSLVSYTILVKSCRSAELCPPYCRLLLLVKHRMKPGVDKSADMLIDRMWIDNFSSGILKN